MKVSKLKKNHLYLCYFNTGINTYVDVIRYTGMREYLLYKFIHIARYAGRGYKHLNYMLSSASVNDYVTPVGNMFEKYLELFNIIKGE